LLLTPDVRRRSAYRGILITMSRHLQLSLCLMTTLCTGAAFAQPSTPDSTGSAPVAYIYVAASKSADANQIFAFAAASNGKLTEVKGSPFPGNVSNMAVNEKYLFGTDRDQVYIHSFTVEPDGALKEIASLSAQKYNSGDCGGLGPLFLDQTGTTLYDLDFNGNACANNIYQSFRIDKTIGDLEYLGSDGADAWFRNPLSFVGNNTYAYGAVCLYDMYWKIYAFQRHSDGMLTEANVSAPTPTAKGEGFYCPNLTTADHANHVVISLQAVVGVTFGPDGPPQLATYTAETSGNLTTKSTRDDMPETAVGSVTDIAVSPSGKLLAVGGTAGLQIFHFNGSDPITRYTGLLTTDDVSQLFWDNDNHLYAISQSSGKLFVFTTTPTSFSQASGSPYMIRQPTNVTVLPRT
jgi:6-phosphogluconolactonase (cycloisomerase 2 family)